MTIHRFEKSEERHQLGFSIGGGGTLDATVEETQPEAVQCELHTLNFRQDFLTDPAQAQLPCPAPHFPRGAAPGFQLLANTQRIA